MNLKWLLILVPMLLLVQLELSWVHILLRETELKQQPGKTMAGGGGGGGGGGGSTTASQLGLLQSQRWIKDMVTLAISSQLEDTERHLAEIIDMRLRNLTARIESSRQLSASDSPPLPYNGWEVPVSGADVTSPPPPKKLQLDSMSCKRQRDVGRYGKKLEWEPREGLFLLAMCTGGQFSNRLMCMRQNMVDAALLGRTLILPTTRVDYNYSELLDFDHFGVCFGPNSFISLEQYLDTHNGSLTVDKMLCLERKPEKEVACRALENRFMYLSVNFRRTDITRTTDLMSERDMRNAFPDHLRVVAFGNMFGVGVKEWRLNAPGGGPLKASATCRSILQPAPDILATAEGFVNTYLGKDFVALHMRRADFFHHCLHGDAKGRLPPCFIPIQQMARCLIHRLDSFETSPSVIFLATDADQTEIDLLVSVLMANGKNIPMLRFPDITDQPWAKPIVSKGLQNNKHVIALTVKSIASFGRVFFGTWTSTFSGDIHRLRDWWHTNSCIDSGICDRSELPDYVTHSTPQALQSRR